MTTSTRFHDGSDAYGDRAGVGQALATALFSAETAVDIALAETARLLRLLAQARSEAYLSAVTGQKAFSGTAAAIGALTETRSQLVSTHNTLAALARKMGLETLAVGPLDKPEDDHGVAPEGRSRLAASS